MTATDARCTLLDVGQGRPVVLLHGIFGAVDNWHGFLEVAPAGFRWILPRLPLYELPLDRCTIAGLADWVVGELAEAGIERAIFGGNSLGGHLALDLAIRRPELVEGLILAGSSGLFERGFDTWVPRMPGVDWIRAKAVEVFHDEERITDELVQEVRSIAEDRGKLLRAIRIAKNAKQTHMGQRLDQVRAPSLLVWGRQDRITPLAVAEEFHQKIAGSELILIDRCGHAPMMERPVEFAGAIEPFLRSLP